LPHRFAPCVVQGQARVHAAERCLKAQAMPQPEVGKLGTAEAERGARHPRLCHLQPFPSLLRL